MPVVLVPVHLRRSHIEHTVPPSCQRAVCLRPFITNDFMTGRAAIPGKDLPEEVRAGGAHARAVCSHLAVQVLDEMVTSLLDNVVGISAVLYDMTSKPPGTTEWE
jgi:GMP synthase (glutamine-hydrolysing)